MQGFSEVHDDMWFLEMLRTISSGMQDIFGVYYGMDWLAMISAIGSLYLLGSQKRLGFYMGFISNIAWTFVNIWAGIMPGVLLNIILFVLNIRGLRSWKQKTEVL